MKYMIAHGNAVHYAQVQAGQSFDSGQPNIEELPSFNEWIVRLNELGVDTSEIEQAEDINREELTVEKYKLEIVLHKKGLLETLNGILEQNPVYKIAWKGTNTVRRTSKTVMELAPLLELSEEQVDALFIEANKIEL